MHHKIWPFMWYCLFLHVSDGWELVVEHNMILGANSSCRRIEYECHASSMKRRMSKIDTNPWSRLPFWGAKWSSSVKSTIKDIQTGQKNVEWFDTNVLSGYIYMIDLGDWPFRLTWRLFRCSATAFINCKQLKIAVNHLMPHYHCVQ